MSILKKLPRILEESRKSFENYMANEEVVEIRTKEKINSNDCNDEVNLIVNGDNIQLMKNLLTKAHWREKINLIYIDPPFYSKADYKINIKKESDKIESVPIIEHFAYKDTWEDGIEDYLKMLCTRLFFMKELLSENGSIFVHLDWHSVHYVKVIMDEVFGEQHFVNEIIWSYKSGGVSKRSFAKKHDTILFYSKNNDYIFNPIKEKSYNRGFKPYRFKGVKEYKDENGWYTLVNMKDVWQIDMVGRTSSERVGYATQKPEMILERILLSCSNEGDLCADFFGGSGTLAAAAAKLNRKWIICDIGKMACMTAHKRMALTDEKYDFCTMNRENDINTFISFKKIEKVEKAPKIHIILDQYAYETKEDIPVLPKYQDTLKDFMDKDSLQLIEYWSVDTNYNGKIFRSVWNSIRTSKGLETDVVLDYTGKNNIAFRFLDTFGIETFIECSYDNFYDI